MEYLRQSTASQEISLGYFLDSTDGNTEEDGLTIANTDIKLRKGGTTTLANKNSGGATLISNGIYSAVLDATDSNTLGMLEIYVHVAGALAVKSVYTVLPAASYDALVTNGLVVAADIVSAGAITTLSGAIVNVDLVDTLTTYTGNTPQTADHTAGIADIPTVAEFNARTRLDADYFSWATDAVANVTLVATVTALTDDAGITQAGADKVWSTAARILTASTNFNDVSTAEVNAQCDLALSDYDGPTNAEMEIRTPTAAQLAYMVENANTGLPVTFTTSGGTTTNAVLNLVDGGSASATADQYNGRLLVFTDGTLKGVVTDITDYDGSNNATITAIPFAPTSSHNARLI